MNKFWYLRTTVFGKGLAAVTRIILTMICCMALCIILSALQMYRLFENYNGRQNWRIILCRLWQHLKWDFSSRFSSLWNIFFTREVLMHYFFSWDTIWLLWNTNKLKRFVFLPEKSSWHDCSWHNGTLPMCTSLLTCMSLKRQVGWMNV